MRSGRWILLAAVAFTVLPVASAGAAERCSRAVIFTTPGVTWEMVDRFQPPNLMRAIDEGATASMSVRTNSSRTTYASGFASLGAGTRVEGGVTTGGVVGNPIGWQRDLQVTGLTELLTIAEEDGYDALPGALAEGLWPIQSVALGNAGLSSGENLVHRAAQWTVLTAMDPSGAVDRARVGPDLLATPDPVTTDQAVLAEAISDALADPCGLVVVDQGDLIRAEMRAGAVAPTDAALEDALLAADDALGEVMASLSDEDLLLVVSPTSPLQGPVEFGICVVVGDRYPAGSLLSSASTRREGVVTLPDIAPTVLQHMGLARHPAMLGRAVFAIETDRDRVSMALEDNDEAVFVDRVRTPITTVFVVAQVAVYLAIAWILFRRERGGTRLDGRGLELAALAIVAFPMCTYLAGMVSQHRLGAWGLSAALVGLDVVLVALVTLSIKRPLDRLLALTAATCLVLVVDVVTGAALQVNTVFSYSPLVAGRFAGFGNTAFSVLGAAAIVTGSLIVQRNGGSRAALWIATTLFAVVVVVDGAPNWGSDVGGVLAFVPAFAITILLLAGRKPTWRMLGLLVLAAIAILGMFLAFDLSRSADERTHLARLFEDIRDRGLGAFSDTIGRKVSTNLRVFTSTIWTYFVPPALAFIGWLLLRPKNRWQRLATEYPTLRAGLIGGLVLCVIGFAVNDSGIVVPAMVLSYLVPVALLAHLLLEREEPVDG
jgi:hypothetical protein